ncbi:MAG: hypothetical protein WBM02_09870 [bacterium]
MKNYLLIGAFWVFGLLLGGVWYQSELSMANAEIARLNRELALKTKRNLIPDMTRMMVMPETRSHKSLPSSEATEVKQSGPFKVSIKPSGSGSSAALDQEEFAEKVSEMFEDAKSADEAFSALSDLWNTRRELALASMVDNLSLTSDEIVKFESVVSDMNDLLADAMSDLFDRYELTDEEPSVEEAFRVVNDLSGVFVGAYDSLDTVLPGRWRGQLGSPLDLTAFIDPMIFKPFLDPERDWYSE